MLQKESLWTNWINNALEIILCIKNNNINCINTIYSTAKIIITYNINIIIIKILINNQTEKPKYTYKPTSY